MANNEKLTREKIKKTVEDFFSEQNESELTVTIYLDSDRKYSICTFHIEAKEREVHEDTAKSVLIISNYISSLTELIPDSVDIPYEEVTGCKTDIVTGETEKDVFGDILDITFKNGTVLEFGFLYI